MMNGSSSQWLFPLAALSQTPSLGSLQRQMYDKARGVEFLFRLGSSLGLPTPAMFTAATWFHRFYMRYSLEEFHRQDVAAACIFLATKTEECGRKLRDVAKVCFSKATNTDVKDLPPDSKGVDQCQSSILLTEEVLIEALCFDFVVDSPHAELVELFRTHAPDITTQEYAWSLAHDSFRTPLCVLYSPQIIAAACFVLAQRIVDGPNSSSLDARISSTAPSASLPTPPSHKPASPDASRAAIDHYAFNEQQLEGVASALAILLEFYSVQDVDTTYPYLASITSIPPPATARPRIYSSFSELSRGPDTITDTAPASLVDEALGRTPSSIHGGSTPITTDGAAS